MTDSDTPRLYDPRAVLDFAARRYRHPGTREQAIHDEFGCTTTRYTQVLNRLLDSATADIAVEYGPTMNRLRSLRDAERHRRRARP